MHSYPKSLALFDRAQRVTPKGAQTMSKAPGRVGPLGAFPLYCDRAEGPYLWDVDGHRFLDLFNGNCAVTLGHDDPKVSNAADTAILRYGPLPSLPTELEVDIAERLVAAIPCAEQVRFLKTGSEATEAAVRIARAATGRDVVLASPSCYHGWHSQWQSIADVHPGVPDYYDPMIDPFLYGGDVQSLSTFWRWLDVAAIILEPTLIAETPASYLRDLVALAHSHGALVIFDEMITGVRWGPGGYQAHTGVTPDLATFGKAYANGYPLAFVCGPADLMQHAALVSGTFGGETSALGACGAVLDAYRAPETLLALQMAGHGLRTSLQQAVGQAALPADVVGTDVRFALVWRKDADVEGLTALWQQELADRGVLAHPGGFNPSVALAPVWPEAARALIETVNAVALALYEDRVRASLRGPMLLPAFARTT